MGYGNPLFDGDEPLPSDRPRQRILSFRLWRPSRGEQPTSSVYAGHATERETGGPVDDFAPDAHDPHPHSR